MPFWWNGLPQKVQVTFVDARGDGADVEPGEPMVADTERPGAGLDGVRNGVVVVLEGFDEQAFWCDGKPLRRKDLPQILQTIFDDIAGEAGVVVVVSEGPESCAT
jgi:hypothetical protein